MILLQLPTKHSIQKRFQLMWVRKRVWLTCGVHRHIQKHS